MKRVVDLIFPPLCLHCKERVKNGFFCPVCSELFEFEEFSEKHMAASLKNMGPVETLVSELRTSRLPVLFEGAASFIVYRLLNLNWPWPDVITYTPDDPSHKVGLAVASILKKPTYKLLKNKHIDLFEYEPEGINTLFTAHNILIVGLLLNKEAVKALSKGYNKIFAISLVASE